MAKSKIIKDLANGEVDTMTALKRAKVLISELQDNELLNWINQEISGYLIEATLPDYRIDEGNLLGSYLKGSMAAHMKYSNVSLPLGKMPDDLRSKLLTLQFREGIEALKSLLESVKIDKDGQIGKIIPADFFGVISTYNKEIVSFFKMTSLFTNKQYVIPFSLHFLIPILFPFANPRFSGSFMICTILLLWKAASSLSTDSFFDPLSINKIYAKI